MKFLGATQHCTSCHSFHKDLSQCCIIILVDACKLLVKQQKRRHRVDFYETSTFPILILQSVLAMSVSKGFD